VLDQPQGAAPPPGSPGVVLASDRQRDQSVERLSAACADGRLGLAEFSERLELALSARSMADIQRLESDLGQHSPAPATVAPRSATSWFVGIMSSAVHKGRWVLQPKSHALAVMGECVLDLREAEVAGSYSHIRAVAVMGAVRVIVPEGIDVDVNGIAIMGAKTLRITSARPLPGSPVIRVTALALMGEVSVVTKSPKVKAGLSDLRSELGDLHLLRQQMRELKQQRRALRHLRHGEDEEGD
jgi:Domain of unknown function (DUF1707)/Cell wall-active antibiotics response 4TMS YvqF